MMGAGLFLSVVTNCCVLNTQVSCLVAFGVPPDLERDMIQCDPCIMAVTVQYCPTYFSACTATW